MVCDVPILRPGQTEDFVKTYSIIYRICCDSQYFSIFIRNHYLFIDVILVTEVTHGIKVSVETKYNGRYFRKNVSLYLFTYNVSIENLGDETVQLLGRHWFIFDTGEGPSEVEGSGVIGEQPIIGSKEVYNYQSGCHLRASIGAMQGTYLMSRVSDHSVFKVNIPTLQFFATPRLN